MAEEMKGSVQMGDDILVLENITKVYPNGFVANKDVNLRVKKGEIHALVGENGAGKTTLMKVLFGIENAEEGRILLRGEEVQIKNPIDAIHKGIGMVHQHFMLVPSLTVAENMVLGIEPKKGGLFFDFEEAVRITEEVSKKYNLIVDPRAKVEDIPVGNKQKVEILKALLRGAEVLILDEPTAVLTPQEIKQLFVELKNIAKMGHSIIFISHHLDEVKELCDNLTVLRLGKTVGTAVVADVTEQQISKMMVGRDVVLKVEKTPAKPKDVVLRVKNLTIKNEFGKTIVDNVSFSVRAGEILGMAGVEGNGQIEISETITGLAPLNHGDITVNGESIKGKSIKKIREMQVSHISQDRMTYGVAADAAVWENIVSDRFYKKEYNNGVLLNMKKIHEDVARYIKEYLVKCDDDGQAVRMLSGGNIQKVVVAREFSNNPKLMIANQPTRGIDVGATEFIRKKLVELRDQGAAVLLISADLNEVLELSDSLIVMNGGKIAAYLPDASTVTDELLGEYMLGVKTMSEEEIGRVAL